MKRCFTGKMLMVQQVNGGQTHVVHRALGSPSDLPTCLLQIPSDSVVLVFAGSESAQVVKVFLSCRDGTHF